MKYFLAKFTIYDGEHEHSGNLVIKAETYEEAVKLAEDEGYEVGEDYRDEEEKDQRYFSFGDAQTACDFDSLGEITEAEAEICNRLGVAYYLN